MNIYTKFLSQVCDLTPCSSDRNWYLILLRDTDEQTIHLLNRWIEKLQKSCLAHHSILFIILLDDVKSEMKDFNTQIENIVIVGRENIPQKLRDKAKHCLFTSQESNSCYTLEEINQKFGSYLSKRTMGMFGRCSDCHDLCMREGRKIRRDLQLYRYSPIETQRFAFTKWKRRLCRSVSRLL